MNPIFVGIDVSKASLDIACYPTGEREAVANTEPAITALWYACRPANQP